MPAYQAAGVRDYDNLWDGDISLTANNETATVSNGYFTVSLTADFSSEITCTESQGSIKIAALSSSGGSRSESGYAIMQQSLKQYPKFQCFVSANASDDSGTASASASVILTDGGSNNVTIASITGGNVGGTAYYAGQLIITYDGTNINVKHDILYGAGSGFTASIITTNTNTNVSGWTAAYLKITASTSCNNGSSSSNSYLISPVVVDHFLASKGTQ